MLQECIIGCVLVIIGMILALALVRIASTLLIAAIGLATCGFVVYQIAYQDWVGWTDICLYSLMSGAVGALLALPFLPFSSLSRRK